jgi:hypothetical protein
MYLAIDIVCVYAVLYRSIYHVKIMVEVIRSTQAWYAGHLGIPIPNWLIYLNLILSMDLASMDNWLGVAVNRSDERLISFSKIR